MAARSAQRSTALATDCAQPSSAATPRSRRVNSAQQSFSDAIHSPRVRDSPSLVTQSAQRSATSTPRSRRDFSAQRCNSFSSRLSIPTTPCSSNNRTPLTPINSRGSYRSQKRIPRQTLHNRKKRKLNSASAKTVDENLPQSESNCHSVDGHLDIDHGHSYDVDIPIQNSETPPTHTNECSEAADDDDEDCQIAYLFPGSSLAVNTSNMLLRSFMCCHHLTQRAKSDLLQLLQIHLPEESLVSPSLYMFEKNCSKNCPDRSPEVTEHYYCSGCNASLTGPNGPGCSQEYCSSHDEVKHAFFLTVSVADRSVQVYTILILIPLLKGKFSVPPTVFFPCVHRGNLVYPHTKSF